MWRVTVLQDIQEFKDRMAVVALPALNGEKVQELVNTEGVVFVLVTEVRLADYKSCVTCDGSVLGVRAWDYD